MRALSEHSGGTDFTSMADAPRPARAPDKYLLAWILAVSALVSVATPILAATDLGGSLRVALSVIYLVLVPGVPVAALLRLPYRPISVTVTVAVSLAVHLLSGLAQIKIGFWSPVGMCFAITIASLCATVVCSRIYSLKLSPTWLWSALVAGTRSSMSSTLRLGSTFALLTALALWIWETRIIDLDAVGARGLITVVSWRYFCALALTLVCFAAGVRRRGGPDAIVCAVSSIALATILYQSVSVADDGAVVGTAWVHVGFIDYIGQFHALPLSLDARFSWSGFFDGGAALVDVAGLPDASALLLWSPLFFSVLMMVPVYIVGALVTNKLRTAWVGVPVYLCGNWFQQDYFAPQAVAMVLYLSIVSVLLWSVHSARLPVSSALTWRAKATTMMRRIPGRPAGLGSGRTIAVEGTLVVIAAAMVVTHQLTPVLLIATLILLTAVGMIRYRTLALTVGVLFVWWLSYGAPDYWTGHLHVILGDLGKVGSSLQSGVGTRVSGDGAYHQMQYVRIAWTAAIALTATAGWWLLRRHKLAPASAVLVIAPFTLVLAQSYGGEIILRCFVYSMPVLAPLAAAAIMRVIPRTTTLSIVALVAALFLASVMLTTTRGLNTAFERNPHEVVSAARSLLDQAPRGTTMLPPNGEGVLRMSRVGEMRWPDGGVCRVWTFDCVSQFPADYIFLTSSQAAALEIPGLVPPGWLWDFADQLVESGMYRIKEENTNVRVLERITFTPTGDN
ncbi:hypothetical protein [Rhodococcus erythropolis]|uniref:hypothetical protein n=1 Tax=Rhodococcus erythropolis TaxID=1833 RepID=UPI000878D888|nr:hypothetical protein [Rhodococcus erythropolis]OFV73534.1 hypothetical protein RERY_58600 [Rhodococcus erythropolis]